MTGSHEIHEERTTITIPGKGTELSYKETEILPDGTRRIFMEHDDGHGNMTVAVMSPKTSEELPNITPAEFAHAMNIIMGLGREPPPSPEQKKG